MAIPETTIGALSVAALSGLTYLAYRHSAAYRKIYISAMGISMVLTIAVMAHDIALSRAFDIMKFYIPLEKFSDVKVAVNAIELMTPISTSIQLALVLYLTFLNFLHDIIGEERKPP